MAGADRRVVLLNPEDTGIQRTATELRAPMVRWQLRPSPPVGCRQMRLRQPGGANGFQKTTPLFATEKPIKIWVGGRGGGRVGPPNAESFRGATGENEATRGFSSCFGLQAASAGRVSQIRRQLPLWREGAGGTKACPIAGLSAAKMTLGLARFPVALPTKEGSLFFGGDRKPARRRRGTLPGAAALTGGVDDLYFGSGHRPAAFVAENQIPVARPGRHVPAFQIEIDTPPGQVNGGRQAEPS